MKRMLPYLGAVAVVAVAVYLLMNPKSETAPTDVAVMAQAEQVQTADQPAGDQATGDPATPADAEAGDALAAKGYALGDVALGAEDAPVTIVEYASLTCPHCATFHSETLPTLKSDYIDTGKVRLILREVYFDQFGLYASVVARCGGAARFYAFLDVYFSKQADWIKPNDQEATINEIRRIGRLGGLSQQRLDECMNDEAFLNRLLADYQASSTRDDVRSTPHFIIEGEVIKGAKPLAEFKAVIDSKLGG